MKDPILVIGGGIGGLSVALALARVGREARVFEQSAELREVGAGLGLWTSAIRCLRRLGIAETTFEGAFPIRRAEIATWRGKVLSRVELGHIADELGAQSYVVHRATLHSAIARALGRENVVLSSKCVEIEDRGDRVIARFANGAEASGSVLIGADDLGSIVRSTLWGPAPPRFSGETCYRGVARLTIEDPSTLREIHGPHGLRAAVCALDAERVYFWATRPAREHERDDRSDRKDLLGALFDDWAFHVPEAIAATERSAILKNDLYDRPPIPRWSRGRVTLLGDAAHPTTPNLGQGACMAIEDAVVLARSIRAAKAHEDAFAAYERERLARTAKIVRQSWQFGKISSWAHPALVVLRETMTRATPAWAIERMLREHIGYDAGELPSATASD